MTKYYVDTCIWRDLKENRSDKFRPLGEWAFQFFSMVRINKDLVLYSNLVLKELLKDYNQEDVKELFSIISNHDLLEKVKINEKQTKEAIKLSKRTRIPFTDALHAILSKDNYAILVSRDHHFDELTGIVEVRKPEDLI